MHKLDELNEEYDKLDFELDENYSEIKEYKLKYFTLKSKYQDKLDVLELPRMFMR